MVNIMNMTKKLGKKDLDAVKVELKTKTKDELNVYADIMTKQMNNMSLTSWERQNSCTLAIMAITFTFMA